METMNIIETIVIILGFGLLYFTIKNLLPSYFNEKGRNIATKEDIGQITEIVEEVKNDLEILTQSKLSIISEERNAILEFYKMYHLWLNTTIDISFNNISDENEIEIKQQFIERSNQHKNVSLAQARLDLFIDNESLIKICNKMVIETLKLKHIGDKSLGEIRKINFEITKMKATVPIEEQLELYSKLLDKKKVIFDTLGEDIIAKYKELRPIINDFTIKSREYLYKPTKKQ